MINGSILTFDDLVKINNMLESEGYHDLTIINTVETNVMLNRLNTDMAYRMKIDEKDIKPNVNELVVNVGSNTFKYYSNEKDRQ